MRRPRIYISGKITGIEEAAAIRFKDAELLLRGLGYDPINPMELRHAHDKSWAAFMREDIKALCDCTHIYMLANWPHSAGAQLEHDIAQRLGLEFIYQLQPRLK